MEARRESHGEWLCLVNDNQTFNAIKRFVRLHVGIEAETGIKIDGGEVDYRNCSLLARI